jgi:ABC transporter substrate binding protein
MTLRAPLTVLVGLAMVLPAPARRAPRATALAVALALITAPLPAEALSPKKIPRIGWLRADQGGTITHLNEAFRQRLRELGYVEGENIIIEYRSGRTVDRLASAAAELVRLKVDLIFAPEGALVALAAKKATSTVPIVIALVADPVVVGLVDNLARPAGNVTGPSAGAGLELFGKRLELLKEAVPKVSRGRRTVGSEQSGLGRQQAGDGGSRRLVGSRPSFRGRANHLRARARFRGHEARGSGGADRVE